MASGKVHFKHNITLAAALQLSAAYLDVAYGQATSILVFHGNLLGVLATPDLDQPQATYTEYVFQLIAESILSLLRLKAKTRRHYGKMAKKLVVAITAPYGVFIPHRSWLSHVPPFSIATKVLYFYAVYYIVAKVAELQLLGLRDILSIFEVQVILLIWAAHDLLHLLDDGGMIIFFNQHYYLFGKRFYNMMRKINGEGR